MSSSGSVSSSSSESTESDRSKDRRLGGEGTSSGVVTSGMPMEVVREVREDPPEELEESNWPAKVGYGWVAADVRDQSSLFIWSRLLNSWLNCTPVISKGVNGDIVSLERVSAVDRVCHGQEGATEKFFYMYMCHFSQLHVRLPLDDFTMGVLRALNVAPTQLHPNSWAYLQAFCILCKSLYLEPTPYAFLYFYDTRPRRPATWLSLISRPSINRLDKLEEKEVKEVGELQGKVDKLEEEKTTLEKAKEGWEAERKRLATWKVRCLDSEEKLNKHIVELEEDYDDLKDKYDGAVGELDDLKNRIIQEHINGFEKGLRQAAFFHQDVDVTDSKFDVNKDVVDGKLVKEDESSADEEVEEKATEEEKKVDDAVDVVHDSAE